MTARDETSHWSHTLAQPTPDWFPQAACRGCNPNLFHPTRGEDVRNAKQVCAGCVVREPCLDYGLATGHVGIYGGLSERERRHMRRAIA